MVAIGRIGLLTVSLILIVLGIGLGYIPEFPDVVATILLVVGVILFAIWIILFAIGLVKSGA